ncbi:MAG TPA: hypothetical protein VLY63_08660 [Anaerolineae bacterium]|nr:hypothetical protein [Anaerolineae bacterium]
MAQNTPPSLSLNLPKQNRDPKTPKGSPTNRATSTPAGVKMPLDLFPWLPGVSLVALLGFLYWAERCGMREVKQ